MITKYASLESAEILELKGSSQSRTASLDKLSDFHDYRTEDGYLYARIRAISSRVNKNHDGWPSVELAGSKDIFDKHTASSGGFTVEASKGEKYGFSTFLGKPVFVDHNNSNPERARGVIVDAKLHVEDHKTAAALDPYYASAPSEHMPPTWVELLLEVDADKFPKLAKAIIEGSKDSGKGIDGFSMGCNVEKSVCNICKNAATAPDEYCNHVKMKGAYCDYIDPKTGHKTSKRSYEDCYGVQFFEISAVFDPADETALTREIISSVRKEAENPLPQSDMQTAPEAVDTLREDEVCPVCGSTMDQGHQCDVCGFVAPPDGLDNPDLEKAQQEDPVAGVDQMHQQEETLPVTPSPVGNPPPAPNNMPMAASVKTDMAWQISHPRLAGKINTHERPIQPGHPPATNEPNETVISDPATPTTSRTAASMIAAVNNGETNMSEKTADAAAGAPEAATPDKRVDVTGVGGVDQASNEEASKADAQVEVEGKGGVMDASNESASAPDERQSIEETSDNAGFDKGKRTDDSGPTKTWSGTDGQASPVGGKAFPTSATKEALDSGSWPKDEENIGSPSGAKKGTEPVDPVGKADERVDVLKAVTTPANNSGPTKTWSGTDGNGVTKQQPAVTKQVATPWTSSVVEILKLADAEVELGLIEKNDKYDRIAELEQADPAIVEASLAYVAKIKTAGLRKNAATKQDGVGRVPSFRQASAAPVSSEPSVSDDQLFM